MSASLKCQWQYIDEFHDIFRSGSGGKNILNHPGVYLWVENIANQGKVIAYVGKSQSTLYHRLLQHYRHFAGGLYSIPCYVRPEPYCLSGEHWVFQDNDKCIGVIQDLKKQQQIIAQSFDYMKIISLYVCAPGNWDKSTIANIERNLLWDLQPLWTKWGTKTKPKNRIVIQHGGKLTGDEIKDLVSNTQVMKEKYANNMLI